MMISSAVIIPDAAPAPKSPSEQAASPTLKRRQSSETPEPEASKRPRLDTAPTNGSHHNSPPPSATASSPSRRKSTITPGGADEKSRNRRLFGGLLSTLSASSNRPSSTVKRRDEIEQRQRERLKRDDEEVAEARRQKREELDRIRRVEQRRWDAESAKIKHANMRAMAGFLRTEAEPRIYWRPWEMRAEDEERVKRQKGEVEEVIQKALEDGRAENGTLDGQKKADEGDRGQHEADRLRGRESESNTTSAVKAEPKPEPDSETAGQEKADHPEEHPPPVRNGEDQNPFTSAPEDVRTDDTAKDDDHGGDELLEGHDEDQVIY